MHAGSSCGSAVLTGPIDENGEPPARTMLLRLQANWTNPAVIRCQVMVPDGEMHMYNPRLRLFFTEGDGGVCELFSHNDSRSMVDEECEGFHYTYYEHKGTNMMNFSYHILPLSPRTNRSVVMCGVNPGNGVNSCFEGPAALILIQADAPCNPSTTSTINPSKTSTSKPPTASDSKHSMIPATESLTTIDKLTPTPTAVTPPPTTNKSFTTSVGVSSEVFISVVVILAVTLSCGRCSTAIGKRQATLGKHKGYMQ